MARPKNYLCKVIFGKVTKKTPVGAHIRVPSQWTGEQVRLKQLSGIGINKILAQSFIQPVRRLSEHGGHIILSTEFVGEIFEITLLNHEDLYDKLLVNGVE